MVTIANKISLLDCFIHKYPNENLDIFFYIKRSYSIRESVLYSQKNIKGTNSK